MSMSSVSTSETNLNKQTVLEALKSVHHPEQQRSIVDLDLVHNLRVCGGNVALDIELPTAAHAIKDPIRTQVVRAIKAIAGVQEVAVTMKVQRAARKPETKAHPQKGLEQVKACIAIASGKGGVGKSTVATNLAVALAKRGAKVGLMDADVYGPSVSKMLGGQSQPSVREGSHMLLPLEKFGIKFISLGLLLSQQTPVIWRGPMATRLVQQFLSQVEWGELDYLLIDLPPGTGDVQLTLTQAAPLAGAVIVTTPQEVAVGVTMRGLRMFEQVRVPILGIIENMSHFVCPSCGHHAEIFRHGGGRKAATQLGLNFLGEVPLDDAITLAGDQGQPIVIHANEKASSGSSAQAFIAIADNLLQQLQQVEGQTAALQFHPQEIRIDDAAVSILWSDGYQSRYPFRELRLACPCAVCVDEWSGERRLDPATVPKDVKPIESKNVGRYAVQLYWSDGHRSGIYSFDKLRAMGAGTV